MRLLYLADAVFEDLPGGSRTAARQLARGMIQKGHDVTFLVGKLKSDSPMEEIYPDGRHVVRYEGAGQGLAFIKGGFFACRKLWDRQAYDIVHTQFALASTGPLKAIPWRVPRVRTFHGPWDEESVVQHGRGSISGLSKIKLATRSAICRLIETASLRSSNAVITLSECFRDKAIERYGVDPKKMKVIPGGADLERFRLNADKKGVRKSLGLPQDRRIVLSVRRLAPRMGLENLIAAMPDVVAKHADVLLIIGGNGPLKAELEEQIAKLGLSEHVQLRGFVPDDDLGLHYQAADLFVIPTMALEGFGLVTVEALASGLPVVGTPVGGTVEILSKLDHRLIAKGCDPGDIANAVLSYFDGGWACELDPERLRRFITENYSWERHYAEIESVYRSLLAGSGIDQVSVYATGV